MTVDPPRGFAEKTETEYRVVGVYRKFGDGEDDIGAMVERLFPTPQPG
jgi:hypothetical protein